MRIFVIKNRKKELKRKKEYDKYYVGDITNVSIRKNLKDKLQQILNSTDIFNSYNDMFVYFLFRFEERKDVFRLLLRRYKDEVSAIKKHSDTICRKFDYMKERRDYFKAQSVAKTQEIKRLRQLLKTKEGKKNG